MQNQSLLRVLKVKLDTIALHFIISTSLVSLLLFVRVDIFIVTGNFYRS